MFVKQPAQPSPGTFIDLTLQGDARLEHTLHAAAAAAAARVRLPSQHTAIATRGEEDGARGVSRQ